MTDLLVSIAGWLGQFLLNFFDFVFFLAFLLCLFICLGHAFGYSVLSGKAQRSLVNSRTRANGVLTGANA